MLAAKRSAGVAAEVNLRERVTCIPPPIANKVAHFSFVTQRRCHQKTKTRVSVALQKGLMSSKILLKKTRMQSSRMHTTYFGGHHKMSVPGGSASEMSASSERSPGRPPRWTDKHL